MHLIEGHLSLRAGKKNRKKLWCIYVLLKDDPYLLEDFYKYHSNSCSKKINRNWIIGCSLLGIINNKTVTELIKEFGICRDRVLQIFRKFQRTFKIYLKKTIQHDSWPVYREYYDIISRTP